MNKTRLIFFLAVTTGIFVSCTNDQKMFTMMDVNFTKVDFSNDIIETEEFNINQYMYIYNGGGVALGDVNGDGLADIYFTANQGSNKLYINQGNFKFKDVTEQANVGGMVGENVWTTGVTMVDLNHDGWLDIYVNQITNFKHIKGRNHLYINQHDGTFSEEAQKYGLDLESFSQQCVFFDYDLDGDLDMYQVNHSIHDLDVYVKAQKRMIQDSLAGDKLFRNDHDFFVNVSQESGIYSGATGYGLAVGISDLDGNGWPDIYISNDFHENDYLYFNQGDGTFKESVSSSMPYVSTFSMGNDIADINNDGLMDIFTLDMKPEDEIVKRSSSGPDSWDIYNFKLSFGYHHQYPRNMLHLNKGNLIDEKPFFSEIGQLAGVDATDWSWSVLVNDFDNDRLKDIFISNGICKRLIDLDYINYIYNDEVSKTISSLALLQKMPDGKATNYAFQNQGGYAFENVSKKWGLDYLGYSMGSSYADLDNDGDQDLVVNNLNSPATLYRNNTESINENNYLAVVLEGDDRNTHGIGAKIIIKLDEEKLVQEMNPVRGWLSSSDFKMIFGLGKANNVNQVNIRWADGRQQSINDVKANQTIKLSHINAALVQDNIKEASAIFTRQSPDGVGYVHKEDDFIDFNVERLIPHKLSTEGPKIGVGDVNGDGKDDFYVGGASGQPGELYIQTSANLTQFEKVQVPVFEADQAKEDIDVAFFDSDGDGDLDLYVVSGGGHVNKGNLLKDRLYINKGNLEFEKSSDLPTINVNGSCVVAEDFNGDGSVDLFIGGRSVYGNYGVYPQSFLLWNDGYGKFKIDDSTQSGFLEHFGMVTDAVWLADQQSLFVVGEWMPITQILFQNSKITKTEINNSTGWWNTIYLSDLDGDSDQDLLLGNAGKNLDLKTSVRAPVRLIVNDWDQNNSMDPIITHYNQDQEWVYFNLDALVKQLPRIKNRYTSYSLYANHQLSQMFSESDLANATIRKVETFNSVILWNNGPNNFEIDDLPDDAQSSQLQAFYADDFNHDNTIDILSAGNFYGNAPIIGQSAASCGNFLIGMQNRKFKSLEPSNSGFIVPGQARDIKKLVVGDEDWLIVSRNDDALLFFKICQNPCALN